MIEIIIGFLKDNIIYVLTSVGAIFTLMNKSVQGWIRKPFIKKTDRIALDEAELNLTEKSLKYMEKYLEFQDERFSRLLEENKRQLKEIEDSKLHFRTEMDSYKKYMKNVHAYVIRLQKLLTQNNIPFKKYDDEGLF
jgi:hypothetical protein